MLTINQTLCKSSHTCQCGNMVIYFIWWCAGNVILKCALEWNIHMLAHRTDRWQSTNLLIHAFDNLWALHTLNSLRPRQNKRHFADDVFKCNFLNGNVWIPIKISLKFVPKSPINNISALVQIMAWRRTGDKPLSEPMVTEFNDAYMRHSASMS